MVTREHAKGIVGQGWASLIDEVYDQLSETDRVYDVKEKWGGLRISIWGSERALDLAEAAEDKSFEVCEFCGRPGKPRRGAWIKTLCWRCLFKRKIKKMLRLGY